MAVVVVGPAVVVGVGRLRSRQAGGLLEGIVEPVVVRVDQREVQRFLGWRVRVRGTATKVDDEKRAACPPTPSYRGREVFAPPQPMLGRQHDVMT